MLSFLANNAPALCLVAEFLHCAPAYGRRFNRSTSPAPPSWPPSVRGPRASRCRSPCAPCA
eukprot:11225835-Lingulodinium_polyedra.AAC.1